MGPEQLVFVWLTISSVSLFTMVFGIRYINNKENMALIEKGINPKLKSPNVPTPFISLKLGLLLVGAGLGLFVAYLMDNFMLYSVGHDHGEVNGGNVAIYFALIAIGGGGGLITSYRIEKKEVLDKAK